MKSRCDAQCGGSDRLQLGSPGKAWSRLSGSGSGMTAAASRSSLTVCTSAVLDHRDLNHGTLDEWRSGNVVFPVVSLLL